MIENLRLTKKEQELIRKKCIDINRLLMDKGQMPIQESKFLHKILEKSVRYANVGVSGEIIIDH